MNDDYQDTLEKLKANINKMNGNDAVVVQKIESLDQAVDVLTTLSTGERTLP